MKGLLSSGFFTLLVLVLRQHPNLVYGQVTNKTLTGHKDKVLALTVLQDGTLASGSHDLTIRLWNTQTGESIKTLTGHRDIIMSLAVLQDGTLASSSGWYEQKIRLWNPKTGELIKELAGSTSYIWSLTVLQDGTLVSASGDRTIRLWNTLTGKVIKKLYTDWVVSLAVLQDGTLVSSSFDKVIHLWNTQTGGSIKTLTGHTGTVYSLAVLKDGTLTSGSEDKTIRLWNTQTGDSIKTLTGHTDVVFCLTVLKDGTLASGSYDKTIRLWNTKTGDSIQTLTGHTDYVTSLAVLQDGTLASGSNDKTIRLWNIKPSVFLPNGAQCGGIGWNSNGPSKCAPGSTCYILTDYFYQCVDTQINSDCLLFPSQTTSNFKDWRNVNGTNYVSPVKDQSTCNACWAFAVIAAFESFNRIYNRDFITLFSEQHLIDCVGIGDCVAGFPDVGTKYALTNGIYAQNQYRTYNNSQTSCQNSSLTQKLLGLKGYQTIINDELLMKTALDKIGPLIVSLNVAGLNNYKPGDIINDPNCSPVVNHNALAVGYGTDTATGLDYYIVKNSWGSQWGDNGYFRIARGKNMCGIGLSAIYLCPNRFCRDRSTGQLSQYKKTSNCQCGGKGFLGTSVCENQGSCFERYPGFFQCNPFSIKCPPGWECNQNTLQSSNLKSFKPANLSEKCDVNTVCNEGNCYAQNKWFSRCLNYCPKGWSCQNPSVNASNLVLWKYENKETYFKRLNNSNWVMIVNTAVVYNLIQNSNLNDTVVLFDSYSKLYYCLNSEKVFYSTSLKNIYSSDNDIGSWVIVFNEAKDEKSVWHFQENYFVNIESLAKNTWILMDRSPIIKNQLENLGVDSFFQVMSKSDKELILYSKVDMGFDNRYFKLTDTFWAQGNCNQNDPCNLSTIIWEEYLLYNGTYTSFYPGAVLYGPRLDRNETSNKIIIKPKG